MTPKTTWKWIGRAENLAVAGPSGTGKSHFVEALAHTAIDNDLRVAWFTLETLTTTVGRAKAQCHVFRRVFAGALAACAASIALAAKLIMPRGV